MDAPDCITVFLDECSIIKSSGIDEDRKKWQYEFEDHTGRLGYLIGKKLLFLWSEKAFTYAGIFKCDIKCSSKMREILK